MTKYITNGHRAVLAETNRKAITASLIFGCSIANAKRLFAENAKGFLEMAEKARQSGKKVNGYTEKELRQSAFDYLEASK